MNNIVFLDGYAVKGNDLDYERFWDLGKVTVYDYTPPELVIERAAGADIILNNKTAITKQVIDALPRLKYIGQQSTGYDNVDAAYAAQKGIIVTNCPKYSTESVAQTVFAHILHHYNSIADYNAAVLAGEWVKQEHFCFYRNPTHELFGKTLGIVGYGSIGAAVAKIGSAFGMKILVHTRSMQKAQKDGYQCVTFERLLRESDIVTLHLPLNQDTRKIINKSALSLMKKNAILINTARGGLIDEEALAQALNDGDIAGAGLDVLAEEPPKSGSPLIGASNCVITPHTAWFAREARLRLLDIVYNNLKAFLDGKPVNVVR